MTSLTRHDAPMMVGQVIDGDPGVIRQSFQAVPMDGPLRDGFLRVLAAMRSPQFDAMTFPPPCEPHPEDFYELPAGGRPVIDGALYPNLDAEVAMAWGTECYSVERGLIVRDGHLVVLGIEAASDGFPQSAYRVLFETSPDQFDALDPEGQEQLLAAVDGVSDLATPEADEFLFRAESVELAAVLDPGPAAKATPLPSPDQYTQTPGVEIEM